MILRKTTLKNRVFSTKTRAAAKICFANLGTDCLLRKIPCFLLGLLNNLIDQAIFLGIFWGHKVIAISILFNFL